MWAGEGKVSMMKTNLVFAVHATGVNEHVRTRRTSGQAWSTSEQRHGGGFGRKRVNFDTLPSIPPAPHISLLF